MDRNQNGHKWNEDLEHDNERNKIFVKTVEVLFLDNEEKKNFDWINENLELITSDTDRINENEYLEDDNERKKIFDQTDKEVENIKGRKENVEK